MPRLLWNGTISFGLVQAPVSLYSASGRDKLGFDLLDRRTLNRVGYQPINKETGEEVGKEDVVRGYQYADKRYVLISEDELRMASDHPAHTVDLVAFVERGEIPPMFYESPYYLAPMPGGEKAYALLRETLRRSAKTGIAQVVIRTRKHLAAVMPCGPALVLNTLRWDTQVKPYEQLPLPAENPDASGVKEKELAMAAQLVASMTRHWDAAQYHDIFRSDIMALIRRKIQDANTQQALEAPAAGAAVEEGAEDGGQNSAKREVQSHAIELADALTRSLQLATGSSHKDRSLEA